MKKAGLVRVAHRQRAKEMRALALEAQVLLDQSEARLKGLQKSLPNLNRACTVYPALGRDHAGLTKFPLPA
jgi:hypothetical protein